MTKIAYIGGQHYTLEEMTLFWSGPDPNIVKMLDGQSRETKETTGPADGDPRALVFHATIQRFDGKIIIDDEVSKNSPPGVTY